VGIIEVAMIFAPLLVFVLLLPFARCSNVFDGDSPRHQSICVFGCSPYVDISRIDTGLRKYRKLTEDMASECDIIVHLGDTKPASMPCNSTTVTLSLRIAIDEAKK